MGMMVAYRSTTAMFLRRGSGRAHRVTGLFELDLNLREFRTQAKSLHFLRVGDRRWTPPHKPLLRVRPASPVRRRSSRSTSSPTAASLPEAGRHHRRVVRRQEAGGHGVKGEHARPRSRRHQEDLVVRHPRVGRLHHRAREAGVVDLVLLECAPKVVDQLNMVANFARRRAGLLVLRAVPLRLLRRRLAAVLVQVDAGLGTIKSAKMPAAAVPVSAARAEYFDEDPLDLLLVRTVHRPGEVRARQPGRRVPVGEAQLRGRRRSRASSRSTS